MSFSAGLAIWKVAFQLSPIILTNGIASFMPGGMLPLIAITEALNFPLGLLSGGENIELDHFFANFEPLPGTSLVRQDIGHYPFANQAVAANAVIAQPNLISMKMTVVAHAPLGYITKLPIMIAVAEALKQHNASGGTYIVATPSYIYTNCLLKDMRDTSTTATKQPQNTWTLDFERPLLTLDQAQQALNNLTNQLNNGTVIQGAPSYSGLSPTVGTPASLAVPSIIPSATGSVGGGSIISTPLAAPGT